MDEVIPKCHFEHKQHNKNMTGNSNIIVIL